MNKTEQAIELISTAIETIISDHKVEILEHGKIHICGDKYHFTVEIIDVIDDSYDAECEKIRDRLATALSKQFQNHDVIFDDDGNLNVMGAEFNFSVHLADVKTKEDSYGELDDFDFNEIDHELVNL